MGIETALLGSSILGAGASILGGNKAAKSQQQGLRDSTDLQRQMFDQGLEITSPFRDAGQAVLPALQGSALAEPAPFQFRDSASFLKNYFSSPEYQALNAAGADNVLRNASATGGFRSGATQVDLQKIAPLLGIQALQNQNSQDLQQYGINQNAEADRFNRLFGLAGLGANIATGNATAGQQFGSSAGANAVASGVARGNQYLNGANAISGLGNDAASIFLGSKNGWF